MCTNILKACILVSVKALTSPEIPYKACFLLHSFHRETPAPNSEDLPENWGEFLPPNCTSLSATVSGFHSSEHTCICMHSSKILTFISTVCPCLPAGHFKVASIRTANIGSYIYNLNQLTNVITGVEKVFLNPLQVLAGSEN